MQELLSFDPAEGPKSLAVIEPAAVAGAGDGTSGLLLLERLAAVARVRIDPRVSAKAKRLGREVSLKVCGRKPAGDWGGLPVLDMQAHVLSRG